MTATITPLEEKDIAEAANVIVHCFSEKWRAPATAEFARKFKGESHPTHIFVARVGTDIVGVAGCLENYFTEFTYGLCWVGVLESHRRHGIARGLIEAVERFIKTDLLQGNPGSLLLATDGPDYYQRMGYELQPFIMHDGGRLMAKLL